MAQQSRPGAVVENRIEVAASPEVLWACFANLSKWPQWFPALTESEWLTGSPWTIGAQFRQSMQIGFPFGEVTTTALITEIGATPFVTWQERALGIDVIHSFHFDDTPAGTEALSRQEFYGKQVILMRLFFLTRRVHSIYQAGLQGLKAYVEVGSQST